MTIASRLPKTKPLGTLYLMDGVCQVHELAWWLLVKDTTGAVSLAPFSSNCLTWLILNMDIRDTVLTQ